MHIFLQSFFPKADCKFLPNKIVTVAGTFEDACISGKESAYLIAVGNLRKNQEYTGLLIEYFYKTYKNPGVDLMKFFGYFGYYNGKKQIKEINIAACNAISGRSAPFTENFSKYFGKTIDDSFIQDFLSFITSKLKTISIDQKIKSLIVRKYQKELEKNKGKKFIDYKDGVNFNMYFEATGEIIERVNNLEDLETYFSQMNPNDINCAVYKIYKKANLDAFRRDIQNNPQLLEFQSFIKNIVIK